MCRKCGLLLFCGRLRTAAGARFAFNLRGGSNGGCLGVVGRVELLELLCNPFFQGLGLELFDVRLCFAFVDGDAVLLAVVGCHLIQVKLAFTKT